MIMKDIMLIDEDWGCLDLSITPAKIDVLPRITMSDMTGAFLVNVGFFIFTLNLVVLDKDMRELNRECRKHRNNN